MEVGLLEQKLRALPGVLDCSVSAEGVAVVVHPEMDPRLIELHAQMLLGEAGDRRPLLVLGGMTVGPRVLPSGRSARPRRHGPSPWSLVGFAALVLALLAVVPIAGRESRSDGAGSAAGVPAPVGLGRLPVVDDPVVEGRVPADEIAVALPPVASEAVQPVAVVFEPSGSAVVRVASAPMPALSPTVVAPAPAAAAAPVAATATSKGKGKGHGHGRTKGSEVRTAGHGHGVVSAAAAAAAPGKVDPPGRRRGHEH